MLNVYCKSISEELFLLEQFKRRLVEFNNSDKYGVASKEDFEPDTFLFDHKVHRIQKSIDSMNYHLDSIKRDFYNKL